MPDMTTALKLRPVGAEGDDPLYVRSYLYLRLIVGALALLMPFELVFGLKWLEAGATPVRGSLSSYYHTGVRDAFVGNLCVIGVFLILYKITEWRLDNLFSVLAGIGAIGVGLFPTGTTGLTTAFQDKLTEDLVEGLHRVATGLFIGFAVAMCVLFGKREGERSVPVSDADEGKFALSFLLGRSFWRRFHYGLALLMVGALVYLGYTQWQNVGDAYSILIAEWACINLFGLSWLLKGAELKVLFGKGTPREDIPSPPTPPVHPGSQPPLTTTQVATHVADPQSD